jgi:hypothetical protein
MTNKRLTIILTTAAILLSIPLISMQFTNKVDLKIQDFIIIGILLFGTGLLCELVMRNVKSVKNRIIFCGAICFVLLLFWAELAVGIFGSQIAGS